MRSAPFDYNRQHAPIHYQILIWLSVVAGCLLFIAAIIGAPLALNSGYLVVAIPLYHAFSLVCHQIPERSFFIGGQPFAVCARCFGLYAGFSVVALAYPLVRSLKSADAPARRWLFLAAAPLAIDYALGVFGIWNNTHSSRFLTGFLLGSVAVFYVMPGLLALGLRLSNRTAVAKPPAETLPANYANAPSDYSAPHRRI